MDTLYLLEWLAEERTSLMARTDNLYELPRDLPVPVDDGACDHLVGMRLPSVPLLSTAGRRVDLANLVGSTVVYCYPRTGRPDQEPPQGWNDIPGARGCTPQSCAFRDHYQTLQHLGARVFGLSTQDTDYQREAVERLHLAFELLSDAALALTRALRLPTFEVESMTLIKRLTLIIDDGRIVKVFYPVFPPDQNAAEVLDWLSRNPRPGSLTERGG
jgi:peroxiredoxin